MEAIWYYAAVLLAKILRALPLRFVAGFGRFGGEVAYWIDARHRRVASENIRRCMPEMSEAARRHIVREHYRRLGENYSAAVKTSAMSREQLCPYLEIIGEEKVAAHSPRGAILALGHFGNFELYAHTCSEIPGMQRAATYRGLKQQRLDGLVRRLRDESGCRFFDRRREARALKSALREDRLALGLLSDLHGGRKGLNLRFFNQECSVSPASALFALRYDLPLYTAICFRVGLARWRIEIGDEIPTRVDGRRRRVHELMAEIMSIFETAVRRDPANWFWVHDRWRFVKRDRAANLASCLPVTDPSVSHGQDLPESSRAKYAGGR